MSAAQVTYPPSVTWRIKDRLVTVRLPAVMGILNATPDSFHAPSRITVDGALRFADKAVGAGAAILDIGGASSRPGSTDVAAEVELLRVLPVIEAIHARFPDVILSIDTYHASVAKGAVEAGAGMVNDIGAGLLDEAMFETVAALAVPYVMMHMQGTPGTMQLAPTYADVVAEVIHFLSERLAVARKARIADVLIDPGFGFGKTTTHNFALLNGIERMARLGVPVLVGLSRKRMVNEVLGLNAEQALNGTSIVNTIALLNGAAVLRVHDVAEAIEAVKLVSTYRGS